MQEMASLPTIKESKDFSHKTSLKYSSSTMQTAHQSDQEMAAKELERIGLKRSGATSLSTRPSTAFYGLETYSTDSSSSDSDEKIDDIYIPRGGFGDELGDNSIIPEVAASIPITDDTQLPVFTFRVLLISTILSIFSAGVAQLFFFRYNHITIDSISQIILSYPLGILLAKIIPRKWKWLNPGPFNHKEHTLIIIICFTSTSYPYQNILFIPQRFYLGGTQEKDKIGYVTSILFLLLSQCLGYSFGGILHNILVKPAAMWWPSNLVLGNLIHSFHGTVTKKITTLRLRMFQTVVMAGFLYQFLPSLFAPILSSVSLLCLALGGTTGNVQDLTGLGSSVTDSRPFIAQFGSSLTGGGMFMLSFDWSSTVAFSPLVSPLWSTLNVLASCVISAWIVTPLLVYYNLWDGRLFPAYSTNIFNANGTVFDQSSVLDPLTLTLKSGIEVPELRFAPGRMLVYAAGFATITSLLSQFFLYYSPFFFALFNNREIEEKDVHARLMESYPALPSFWYAILAVLTISGCLTVTLTNYEIFELDFWAIPLALLLTLVFAIPNGIILAIANQSIGLNILSQLIMGYLKPGSAVANLSFKMFGTNTLNQAFVFLSGMKLAYYMKIPPRLVFFGIIYGTFTSGISSYITFDYLVRNISVIWQTAQGNPVPDQNWRTTLPQIILSAAQVFGVASPQRVFFGSGSFYYGIHWAFIVGALMPIIFFYLAKAFPHAGFNYFNWPIIFQSVGFIHTNGSNGIITTFLVVIGMQYFVRLYRRKWYDRYNYIVAAGLDFATVIVPMIVIALQSGLLSITTMPSYSLNPDHSIYGPDYCGPVRHR